MSKKVLEVIKLIYEDLSSEDLLRRCLRPETQNSKESLNCLISTFSPKHIYVGTSVVKLVTSMAACIFNEGSQPILEIISAVGVTIGPRCDLF